MPSLTRNIPHESDLARTILTEMRYRIQASIRDLAPKHKIWREAEDRTLAYLPERELDAMRRQDRENGLPQYTTIQIPYSYAVLMSAHTYFTSVFMGRSPIFQFTGLHGESEQQTQAVEALLSYQVTVGYALPPLYTWLYDSGKYGAGVVGLFWESRTDMVSYILEEDELDPVFGQPTGKRVKRQKTMAIPKYSGNRLYNVQPWDFFWDTRFPLGQFQKGEYCGVRRVLSWNDVKRRETQGFYTNIEKLPRRAIHRGFLDSGAEMSSGLLRPETTNPNTIGFDHDKGLTLKHPTIVGCYEIYVELIPKEWGLGESTYPEKWVFTCNDDFTVLVGCQPLGAFHCQYPFAVLVLEAEGYGLIPRGIPETLRPIQDVIDWLVNSHFYNVRAVLNNKVIVDPSRVVMKDVLDPLPGGVVRLKPEAYGTNPGEALTQLKITDVTQNHLRDLQMMFGMGERTMGVNDQIMGLLQGGGRKTATEVRTSTSFGVNRLKTISEFFSATGFDPLALMLVSNTQQYYDQVQKFRIAGDLVLEAGTQFLEVTPETIAGNFTFVPVDGTFPIDRYAQANLWRELMGQIRTFPEISLQYDMTRIFEWVAKLAGLKNITQFRSQIVPDPMLLQQAKLGNVVPLSGRGAGGRSPTSRATGGPSPPGGNILEPGQISGNGPTG